MLSALVQTAIRIGHIIPFTTFTTYLIIRICRICTAFRFRIICQHNTFFLKSYCVDKLVDTLSASLHPVNSRIINMLINNAIVFFFIFLLLHNPKLRYSSNPLLPLRWYPAILAFLPPEGIYISNHYKRHGIFLFRLCPAVFLPCCRKTDTASIFPYLLSPILRNPNFT